MMVVSFGVGLFQAAGQQRPMSIVDEHIHLDTAFKVHDGTYPHRGSLLGQELVEEWACGVGHEAGGIPKTCDDVTLSAADVPSGKYTSGYIHYPTYFAAAEGVRAVVDAASDSSSPISTYRTASALFTMLGVGACAAMAFAIGLRRSGLIGATLAPVAASSVVTLGIMVNPGSTGILSGALIAGTGLGWMVRGWSFWWLAGSTVFAASLSVTSSLPAGVFLVAALIRLIATAAGWWRRPSTWAPKWYHPVVLSAIVLAPVLIWGRYIASTATVSNRTLYDFAAFDSWSEVWAGVISELTTLHSPWYNTPLGPTGDNPITSMLRAAADGPPTLLSILLIGVLMALAIETRVRGTRQRRDAANELARDGHRARGVALSSDQETLVSLAGISTLAVLFLYPPALRLSNAITMGFDHPITDRYSIAFMPLIAFVALLAWRARTYHRLVASIASVGVIGLATIGF